MPESRIAATDRLRQEGRWDEACLFRDEAKKQLRADGVARTVAIDRAWEAMLEKYPPLPQEEPANVMTDYWSADRPIPPPNLVEDVFWVYGNLTKPVVEPKDAPGPGAWAMLHWATKNPNSFYQQMLPKAMAAASKEVDRSGPDTDGAL